MLLVVLFLLGKYLKKIVLALQKWNILFETKLEKGKIDSSACNLGKDYEDYLCIPTKEMFINAENSMSHLVTSVRMKIGVDLKSWSVSETILKEIQALCLSPTRRGNAMAKKCSCFLLCSGRSGDVLSGTLASAACSNRFVRLWIYLKIWDPVRVVS